jgi:hypothetical protein
LSNAINFHGTPATPLISVNESIKVVIEGPNPMINWNKIAGNTPTINAHFAKVVLVECISSSSFFCQIPVFIALILFSYEYRNLRC